MTDGFLMATCRTCAEEVLLAYDLIDGDLVTRCVHCDLVIDGTTAKIATAADLVEAGYPVEGFQSPHGERGCKDGQCGVRQPNR